MNVYNVNPYIRFTSQNSTLHAYSSIKRRIIFDYELIYIQSGNFTLEYDSRNYNCKEGDILLIHPCISHAFYINETPVVQPHVHFDLEFLIDSCKVPISFKDYNQLSDIEKSYIRQDVFMNYPTSPFINVKNKEKFITLFMHLVSGHKSENYLEKKALLINLINIISKDNFPNSFTYEDDYPLELQLKNYIDAGQCFSLTLSQIASVFSYDMFYLEKRFKSAFGESIISYRNNKRLLYAQTLLKDFTVSQVAEKTGFSSIYSFSRAYKLKFGKSPSKK